MAPLDIASDASEAEIAAKQELTSIHPTIRAEIVKSFDAEEWKAMSVVEKLAAVKARLPTVTVSVPDFAKDLARRVAEGEPTFFDRAAENRPVDSDDESEVEEEDEEVMVVRNYWAPKGRCPYGMDTGCWQITEEEMRQHDSRHSCWVSINDAVYDVTKWLKKNPGSADAILENAGKNATEAFKPFPKVSLEKYKVGHIVKPVAVANSQNQAPGAAPEVCPISGKTGVCPVKAMQGQTSTSPGATTPTSDLLAQEPDAEEEDPEEAAKTELTSIHPCIRLEITQSIDSEEWKAMSFVERLAATKARLPTVTVSVSDFEKDAAWRISQGEPTFVDLAAANRPADSDDESEVEEEDEEVMVVRNYWAPKGRCPYGMDTGCWKITEEEMRQHDSRHSCWVSIDDVVYDVTKWLKKHPGGAHAILKHAGKNATEAFWASATHTASGAAQKLEKYKAGHIVKPEALSAAPEVCPISGKTGECPVKAKQGQTSASPDADVCPVSGKSGECPVKKSGGQQLTAPPEALAFAKKALPAGEDGPGECPVS